MSRRPAAFAIPGDITTLTGGYIYERRLLEGLREIGHDVRHIVLGASFPDPTQSDMTHAIEQLASLEPERALILDGLVYGSIDTIGLARVNAPIVAMIHHPLALESGLTQARRNFLFSTERENLVLARHVLVPSPHTASILTNNYGVARERITIARPGTDRPALPPLPRHKKSVSPLILSVGILHPRKGHDVLLKALSRIVDRDWQAVIVGYAHDPTHAAALQNLVGALDLGERVHFAGRVQNDELDELYSTASLFTLATRYEGYGIVFDEALAHGLPIVSCRTGAVPDTVPADAGVLVPPDDPDSLAAALQSLLSDPGRRRRLARAAAQAGKTLPSWLDTAHIAGQVLDNLT